MSENTIHKLILRFIKQWLFLVLLVSIFVCVNFFNIVRGPVPERNDIFEIAKWQRSYNYSNEYLINTPGCKILKLKNLDLYIQKFIHKLPKIICNKGTPPLFKSNLTFLYMITEVLQRYNVTNISDISCCYKEFWRQNPTETQLDNLVRYSKKCIHLNMYAKIHNSEFVKVICKTKSGKKVYEDYFSFVPLKKKIKINIVNNPKPNILIIGLDGMSRINLQRQLSKTYSFVKKHLKAVEFLGYNKVADNTFPNLIPVLTGKSNEELQKTCWPVNEWRFDNCTFLWNNFSKSNYLTAFGEDCARLGIFDFNKYGFLKQPTDYYYTSFSREMEENIGNFGDINCNLCVGGRKIHQTTLNYIEKFIFKMKSERLSYFGFFWSTSLSHDNLNRPALGDLDFLKFFRSLELNEQLKNTVVIFMSDHGIRYGEIRQTFQGWLEERLPFLFIVLPKMIKEKYPVAAKHLYKNSKRLTTPFDLHETIKNLLNLNSLRNVMNTSQAKENTIRGYSLFQKIPKTRSCKDAEIASHWCACQKKFEEDNNELEIARVAKFIVTDLNLKLKKNDQCAKLFLKDILNAKVHQYIPKSQDNRYDKDYTITIKTKPGDGILEATVRVTENKLVQIGATKQLNDQQRPYFILTGTISRLNLYGNQSYCITDPYLKLFCYCKSFLWNN